MLWSEAAGLGQQRTRGCLWVCHDLQRHAPRVSHDSLSLRHSGPLGVYLYELAVAAERRLPAKLQHEVQLLPYQHDQVGLRQHLRERAQARVRHPARALHVGRRHTGRVRKLVDGLARLPPRRRRASDDQRPFRAAHQVEEPGCGCIVQHTTRHGTSLRGGPFLFCRHTRLQRVHRNRDVYRPRTPRRRDAIRPLYLGAQLRRAGCRPRRLRDGLRHARLRHLLEGPLPRLPFGRAARNKHKGRLGHPRHVESGQRVGEPRSRLSPGRRPACPSASPTRPPCARRPPRAARDRG